MTRFITAAADPATTPADKALIILTSHSNTLQSSLVKDLLATSKVWIEDAPLGNAALKLLAIAWYNKASIPGDIFAHFVQRCVAMELQAGGPYRQGPGQPADVFTNASIAQLFRLFALPLPNVERFLHEQQASNLTEQWLLSAPYTLAKSLPMHDPANSEPLREHIAAHGLRKNSRREEGEKVTPSSAARAAKKIIIQYRQPVRETALSIWQKLIIADKRREISDISVFVNVSLSINTLLSKTAVETLRTANFFIWIAYTLYDDFIDEEATPPLLPTANYAHRTAYRQFLQTQQRITKNDEFVTQAFDTMDWANAWELAHCRYPVKDGAIMIGAIPSFGAGLFLAQRAIGHILGPRLVLEGSNATETQKEFVMKGLRHYLIARQLNDDLHDWVDDLSKGHITFIVAHLLKKASIEPGTHSVSEIIKTLKKLFWQSELDTLLHTILSHVARARKSFASSAIINNQSPIDTELLTHIEKSATEALRRHKDEQLFLATYKS